MTNALINLVEPPTGIDCLSDTMALRPEHIGIVDSGSGHCDGVVQVSEYLGADFFHYIDCGALGLLTVRTSGAMRDIEGQPVGLKFEHDNLQMFGADGLAIRF